MMIFVVVTMLILGICPLAVGCRIWLGFAVMATTAVLLSPEVPLENRGPLHLIGQDVLLIVLCLLAFPIALRWAATQIWPDLEGEVSGQETKRFNLVLASLAGIGAGLTLPVALAVAMRGLPGGLGLHLVVAAAALALVMAAWRYTATLWQPFLIAMLIVTAAKVTAGGLSMPDQIDRAAQSRIGPDHGCLRGGDGPLTLDRKRFLTLPDATPGLPGLTLTVMRPTHVEHYRWSLRGKRFVILTWDNLGLCP